MLKETQFNDDLRYQPLKRAVEAELQTKIAVEVARVDQQTKDVIHKLVSLDQVKLAKALSTFSLDDHRNLEYLLSLTKFNGDRYEPLKTAAKAAKLTKLAIGLETKGSGEGQALQEGGAKRASLSSSNANACVKSQTCFTAFPL